MLHSVTKEANANETKMHTQQMKININTISCYSVGFFHSSISGLVSRFLQFIMPLTVYVYIK